MFLAGADGSTPELRPPSIKGALRFWWRAMNGHLSLEELKKQEAMIFGGAGDGQAVRSSFSVQVSKQPNEIGTNLWDIIEHSYATKRNGESYPVPTDNTKGIAYLLYSTFMLNTKEYIEPETEFSFKIIFNKTDHYEHIINALKGLVFFGGLGTRSRRGGGSFWIKDLVCSERLKDKEQDLKDVFCNAEISSIDALRQRLISNFSVETHSKNNYSHLNNAKIYLFDSELKNQKPDWIQSLEVIGKPFFEFRGASKRLHKETPNFGFPILHRNMRITMQGGKIIKKNRRDVLVDKLERRSSPLIFKLIKVNESHIFPVIIWLSGELVPNNYQITDKYGSSINSAAASTRLLTSFFTTKFPTLTPITL
ncbi:MAG: type III-B CRISPR module RAMP protein Cmr1 [Bernardetiaceae bacterium]|nr:type III-B CRISPR module RAMP protein Cmr1 [Bernardetiaceae bacterium]